MDARDFYWLLRRRWPTAALIAAALFGCYLIYAVYVQAPKYSASCHVSFNTGHPHEVILTMVQSKPASEHLPVKTRAALAQSETVAKTAHQWLTQEPPPIIPVARRSPSGTYLRLSPEEISRAVSVKLDAEQQSGEIVVLADSPHGAMDMANAVAWALREHLRLIMVQQLGRSAEIFKARLRQDVARLSELESSIDKMGNQEDSPYRRLRPPEALQALSNDLGKSNQVLDELKRERARLLEDMDAVRKNPAALVGRTPPSRRIEQYEKRAAETEAEIESVLWRWAQHHPSLRARKEELATLRKRIEELRVWEGVVAGERLLREAPALLLENSRKAGLARLERERLDKLLARYQTLLREYEAIARDAATLKREIEGIDQTLERMKLQESLLADLIIIEKFANDAKKDRFRLQPILLVGLGSLILGVGAAYLFEMLDARVSTSRDVQHHLNLPVLGNIPLVTRESPLLIGTAQRTPLWDVFHQCAASLLAGSDGAHRVFLVTSPNPSTGKSTLAANLAVAMASEFRTVLLIDADLRRPTQHQIFKVENNQGLSTLLEGTIEARAILNEIEQEAPKTDEPSPKLPLELGDLRAMAESGERPEAPPPPTAPMRGLDQVTRPTPYPQLGLITSGLAPINPVRLLDSPRCIRFLNTARDMYNVVIIDSPPLLLAPDVLHLAPLCDMTLLTIRADTTSRMDGRSSKDLLGRVMKEKVGVMLTFTKAEPTDSYYYQYYKYRAHAR